tara:strand:- start:1360 stop:1884 length:525 start_codon:yes stop_codon:yes gene_type:complete
MQTIDPNRIRFYQFINNDISIDEFEKWVYDNIEFKKYIHPAHYNDLVELNFRSREIKAHIRKFIKKHFDWKEFEKWRTIELLKNIKSEKIEIVQATRFLRQLYIEQAQEFKTPFISIKLAIGYESELDSCPIISEYSNYNSKTLKKLLEPVNWYREQFFQDINIELENLLKSYS